MTPPMTRLRRAAMDGLYYTRAFRLLERHAGGIGVIFTLHHVRPASGHRVFSPNRILEITPAFLTETIRVCRQAGHDFVSLDEARRRLVEKDFHTPFVCFTLDDGYADNYTTAFPIFREHGVPFTIFLCTGMLQQRVRSWWLDLEDIVARHPRVEVVLNGEQRVFSCANDRAKVRTFEAIYWSLRRMPVEAQAEYLDRLVTRYLTTPVERPPMLTRAMVNEMLRDGLFTPGAHTLSHPALAKLGREEMIAEMGRSRERLKEMYGVDTRHVAYPFGDAASAARREFAAARELGFETGVTTRKGVLYPEHAGFLHALPRVSLNGDYQRSRYVELYLSGVPFRLQPGLPRINVV